jgi:hypothetical protein
MDQTPILNYLSLKKMTVRQIHNNLVRTGGLQAISYPCDTRSLRAEIVSNLDQEGADNNDAIERNKIGSAILTVLVDPPFSLMRNLSRLKHVSRSIAHRDLTGSLGFTVRHLRSVSHLPSDSDRQTQIVNFLKLLSLVQKQ